MRDGTSGVAPALVTGEPVPRHVGPDDTVASGSVNGTSVLLVEVTATSAEGFLAQIAGHVDDARALKPGILHLVDRIVHAYTPIILGVSALAFAAWLSLTWGPDGQPDVWQAMFAGRRVPVSGYPGTVGIATPPAIMGGARTAADLGIVMRNGEAFHTFRQVRRIVLDKTGTLTVATPDVTTVEAAPSGTPRHVVGEQPIPRLGPPRRRQQPFCSYGGSPSASPPPARPPAPS